MNTEQYHHVLPFQLSPSFTDEERIKEGEKRSLLPHSLQVRDT